MKPEIIVMLTHNDKTVGNAADIFRTCKDLPVNYWGFKDVGIPAGEMRELAAEMKKAGKKTCLEVVTYTEEECFSGASLAVELGIDCLMGTLYYDNVWNFLKTKQIRYFPFVGKVSGSPSVLEGTICGMIEESRKFAGLGIHGIDLLAYRHAEAPERLAEEFVKESKLPVIIAGSINSRERLAAVCKIKPFAFTMGSALFEHKFDHDGNFRANLEKVIEIIDLLRGSE